MSDISVPVLAADDTKPCRVCGESIKEVARVCYHCGNYQDWRGENAVGSSVLSLLVALFDVLTVAVPVIVDSLTTKNSALSFVFQGENEKRLSFLAIRWSERKSDGSMVTRP